MPAEKCGRVGKWMQPIPMRALERPATTPALTVAVKADQVRPDQVRPDQVRPDQVRPDQVAETDTQPVELDSTQQVDNIRFLSGLVGNESPSGSRSDPCR